MRLEPVGDAVALPGRFVETPERREHIGHARRIPVAGGCVLRAELIGLQFEVAAVFQKQDSERLLSELAEWTGGRHEDAEGDKTDGSANRACVLLCGVPRGDVRGLVTEDAGKLRLVVEERQDPPRDVD